MAGWRSPHLVLAPWPLVSWPDYTIISLHWHQMKAEELLWSPLGFCLVPTCSFCRSGPGLCLYPLSSRWCGVWAWDVPVLPGEFTLKFSQCFYPKRQVRYIEGKEPWSLLTSKSVIKKKCFFSGDVFKSFSIFGKANDECGGVGKSIHLFHIISLHFKSLYVWEDLANKSDSDDYLNKSGLVRQLSSVSS